jgi:hypothetical protein
MGPWDKVLDGIQLGLDILGMIPGAGEVADLSNAGISALRGDKLGASLSLASAIPLAGWVVGGAKIVKDAVKVADGVTAIEKAADKAITLEKNVAAGKQFEKTVTESLGDAGHKNIAEQVTVRPNVEGAKNVRLDQLSTKDGGIKLTDAKSSETAGLTKNQKTGYPAIEQYGGIVVGNKGAAQGYPAGTLIPPTRVDIVRPKDLK